MTTRDGTRKMPFGKYKGKAIEDLPTSYLKWMVEKLDDDDFIDEAAAELAFRDKYDTHFEE